MTFTEAENVFNDLNAVKFLDETHSQQETRFQRLGLSAKRLLFIIYTVIGENDEEVIRLVSARKATSREEEICNEYND